MEEKKYEYKLISKKPQKDASKIACVLPIISELFEIEIIIRIKKQSIEKAALDARLKLLSFDFVKEIS